MTLNERALDLCRQLVPLWDGARNKEKNLRIEGVLREMRKVARLAASIDISLDQINASGEPDPAEVRSSDVPEATAGPRREWLASGTPDLDRLKSIALRLAHDTGNWHPWDELVSLSGQASRDDLSRIYDDVNRARNDQIRSLNRGREGGTH